MRGLAEGADEGAAHPFGIAESRELRDAFDRFRRGLHALSRHFDAQTLDRLRRRGAGLGDEGTQDGAITDRFPICGLENEVSSLCGYDT